MKFIGKILILGFLVSSLYAQKAWGDCSDYLNYGIVQINKYNWGVKDMYSGRWITKGWDFMHFDTKVSYHLWVQDSYETNHHGTKSVHKYDEVTEWGTIRICSDDEKGVLTYEWVERESKSEPKEDFIGGP